MPNIDIKKPQYRELTIGKDAIDAAARTVSLAFSSEAPVDRFFCIEILDHKPSSVRLGRLRDGGPLLVNHDPDDQIGVVESVEIDSDGVGRAVVRLGKGERADEIFNDIVDGIRRKVSVGYQIHAMVLESNKDGLETYRVTDWEPLEISIVSIPADNSVGVGRSHEENKPSAQKENRKMSDENTNQPAQAPAPAAAPTVDVRALETEFNKKALARINEMQAIGKAFQQFDGITIANQFIAEGRSVAELNAAILERAGQKPMPTSELGMSEREVKQYSFVRIMNALANPTDRQAQEDAAYEIELSHAARDKLNKKETRGITVPYDVLKHDHSRGRRDLTVGSNTGGGYTVATDLLSGSFIDMLRNRMALVGLGATVMNGLNGNIAIPRQTGGATAYWVGEGSAPSGSTPAFDQVTMSPKTVAAYTEYTRKFLLQTTIDAENFVRGDLAKTIALEADRVGLYGSGSSNQPLGIKNLSGINTVDLAGATPTWAEIVDLETQIAADNADIGAMAYLTNSTMRGALKSAPKVSGQPIYIWGDNNTMNGYNAVASNQVESGDIFFANWSDLVLGFWGGLDLQVNPYSLDTTGSVRVTAFQDMDVAGRHPVSFCRGNNTL